jgi:hypothetical protein
MDDVITRLEDSKEICKLVRMILLHDVEIQEFKWMVNRTVGQLKMDTRSHEIRRSL